MELRYCVNHPGRPAIGECVITKKPICPECSTRYEGVNYSKEGLEELKQRRVVGKRAGWRERAVEFLAVAQAPVSFILLYLFYLTAFKMAANILAGK